MGFSSEDGSSRGGGDNVVRRGFIARGEGSTDRRDCKKMDLRREKRRMDGIQGKRSQVSINI